MPQPVTGTAIAARGRMYRPFHDPPSAAGSRPGLRVLVVENHDDTRALLTALVESLGHRVCTAATMHAGLQAALADVFDVLVSDIGLPDGSGWELMRRLGRAAPRYAVAISGLSLREDGERSRAVGFRHHLVKPHGVEQLPFVLTEALRERPFGGSSSSPPAGPQIARP
jgi:two-component system CheB/CheR fusion protein